LGILVIAAFAGDNGRYKGRVDAVLIGIALYSIHYTASPAHIGIIRNVVLVALRHFGAQGPQRQEFRLRLVAAHNCNRQNKSAKKHHT
jgi:hypothetical protein